MKTLIFGNMTFDNFTAEELLLFKNPKQERKALIHSIDKVMPIDESEVDKTIDTLEDEFESWLVIGEFNGEVVYIKEPNKPILEVCGAFVN
jgi:hypothetical protein